MPSTPLPDDIRNMFQRNLRVLIGRVPSVTQLCKELDINRTQFNRYLSGETHPRPEILARICARFDTDARILHDTVETVEHLRRPRVDDFPALADFAPNMLGLDHARLPDGFYRYVRPISPDQVLTTLLCLRTGADGVASVQSAIPSYFIDWSGDHMTWPQRKMRGLALRSGQGAVLLFQAFRLEVVQMLYITFGALGSPNLHAGFSAVTLPPAAQRSQILPALVERVEPGRVVQARRSCGVASIDTLTPMRRGYFAAFDPLGPLRS